MRVSRRQGGGLCGWVLMAIVEGPEGWAEDLTRSGRHRVMQSFT